VLRCAGHPELWATAATNRGAAMFLLLLLIRKLIRHFLRR
jgi:hypothetical protein